VQRVFKNVLTIAVLIGAVCVMLKLGFWQLDRLEWKNDILAKIEQFESVDANVTPLNLNNTDDFQRGYIEGSYINQKSVLIKPRTNKDAEVGYHLLYPFKARNGQNIIVNMGWHSGQTYPIPKQNRRTITGYLKTPDKQNSFTPSNDIENSHFYSIDLHDLEKFYGVPLFNKALYLDSGFPTMQKPRNKHAQYAAFWFGMSGLLVFLAGLFVYKQRKSRL